MELLHKPERQTGLERGHDAGGEQYGAGTGARGAPPRLAQAARLAPAAAAPRRRAVVLLLRQRSALDGCDIGRANESVYFPGDVLHLHRFNVTAETQTEIREKCSGEQEERSAAVPQRVRDPAEGVAHQYTCN